MTALGWDLPPGTRDDDPDAPWNRDELSCWDCGQLDTDCICVPNDEDSEE